MCALLRSIACSLLLAVLLALPAPAALLPAARHPSPEMKGERGQAKAPVTVEVLLFTKRHPARLSARAVSGERIDQLLARADELWLNGRKVTAPFVAPHGEWQIALDGDRPLALSGAWRAWARSSQLRIVGQLDLEAYLAWTIASETLPDTPAAALQAQAVVARTYALAAHRRHEEADLCDLAHCQVLRADLLPSHLEASRQAVADTRGAVLCLDSGALAQPAFHAACGGRTALAREIFGGRDQSGSASAADPGCEAQTWSVSVRRAQLEAVLRESLRADVISVEALRLVRGPTGRVARVQSAQGKIAIRGEAFQRRLGAHIGYGQMPSPWFWIEAHGDVVQISGRGQGHGVGLCQAGAARQARAGRDYRQILAHYFPRAQICQLDLDKGRAAPTPRRP